MDKSKNIAANNAAANDVAANDAAANAAPVKEIRNTKQKRLILDCIKKSGRHMNVDEIYSLIKEHDEKISIATVYRNLRMLEQQGVVKKLYMAEDAPSFYELNESGEHTHHHLVCSRCGAIIDFDEDLLDSLEKTIEEKKGFKIKDHHVVFYGICSDCRKQNDSAESDSQDGTKK